MPYYENVFVARQDISATQVDALADQFTSAIEGQGGQVTKREYWGLRNMAYRIKKNRKGHYILLNIDAPAAAVEEAERQMRIHEDVLRYMTIRVEELEAGPSVVMQSRGGRDDRGRRDDRGGRDDRGRRDDRGGRGRFAARDGGEQPAPAREDAKSGPQEGSGETEAKEAPAAKEGEQS